MSGISYITSSEWNSQDNGENVFQYTQRRSVIDQIQCINFFSDRYILCGDELGYLHIFLIDSLNQLFNQKMFDLSLNKIHGPFGRGIYILESKFSPILQMIEVNVSSPQQFNSSELNDNNQITLRIKSTHKFKEMIQFVEKLSNTHFVISFKSGHLKFFRLKESKSVGIYSECSADNLSQYCLDILTDNYQDTQRECWSDCMTEYSSYKFERVITHLSELNEDITVCCTTTDIVILSNAKQMVEYSCRQVLDQLFYIVPFNRDSFLLGNIRGEMKLVLYNKTKRLLQYIQHYKLPQTNILTSLNKFGSRLLLYTSEKGTFIYDLMSHKNTCLHKCYSTVTALLPNKVNKDMSNPSNINTIVIADKMSFLNIITQLTHNTQQTSHA